MSDIRRIHENWEHRSAALEQERDALSALRAPLGMQVSEFNVTKPDGMWGKLKHAFTKATKIAGINRQVARLDGQIAEKNNFNFYGLDYVRLSKFTPLLGHDYCEGRFMNYSRFIKLFYLVVALGIGFLSFSSSYAQEEVRDSAYLKAIERTEQREAMKNPDEKPKAPVVVQDKRAEKNVEHICLAGSFCKKADFSDQPDARQLINNCQQFESHDPSKKTSSEAHFCYSFLLGFGQALGMYSYVNHDLFSEMKIFCVSGQTDELPRMYLDFMNDNSDLVSKHFSYGVYRFFEETFQCEKE